MTEQDKNISSDEQVDPVIAAVREEYEKKISELKEKHKKELEESEQKHVAQIRALMSGRPIQTEEQKKVEETVQKTYEQTVLEQAQKILKI